VAAARSRWSAWRATRLGALGLAAAIVAVGAVGVLAFETAFEIFHRMFFAGGSYTFDPRTERLVQLFPQRFWFETSIAVGVVALVLAIAVIALSTARLRGPRRAPSGAPVAARRLEPVR
jgi:uncharacterized membrane protein